MSLSDRNRKCGMNAELRRLDAELCRLDKGQRRRELIKRCLLGVEIIIGC